MKWYSIKIAYVFLTILLFGCKSAVKDEKESRVASLPYYNEASFKPNWVNDGSLEKMHSIPDFSLVNQNGDTITASTFENKIYVADFFFTSCPGICPKMTENMSVIQEEFKHDTSVLLLSHSVTPEFDTPEILQHYAEVKGVIDNKWHLVTGNRTEIYQLGRQAYFAEEDLGLSKSEDDFLHTENFILVDKDKHIRGIYNGLNKTAIAQLVADIKTLQNEF